MVDAIRKFLNSLHEDGIPLPLFRDKAGGSVSLTLLIISFSIVVKAILAEKSSDSLMYALGLFGMCGSMYWGKKWNFRKVGSLDVSGGEDVDSKDQKQ